ncbi:MAG: hypothetical protein IT313_09370 [Anaerolineales bacterium]|nr:hypothetical protein [Anaerolineales bacterium]
MKNTKPLVGLIAILFAMVGLYSLWQNITTPPPLPLKHIKPGESLNIDFIKQLGGSISSGQTKPIAINENLVYAGIGPRLAILDISDHSNIRLLGQSDIILDNIGEVVLAGDYVYIAPGVYGDDAGANQQLHIVDVSNPRQPQYLGTYSPKEKCVSSVYVSEKYLYITAKDEGSDFTTSAKDLYILDISTPDQPKEISHYAFREGISDIAVLGNYIYIATHKTGLRILDISDLQNPREIIFSYQLESAHSLKISGKYLYLIGSNENSPWEFYVFDISNPQEPKELVVQAGDVAELVSVYQDIAYFWELGSQYSISSIDLGNPKEPREIGTQSFIGRVVSILKNIAFVMDANRLKLIDLSNPMRPVELGSYITLVPEQYLPELYLNGTKGIIPTSLDIFLLDFADPTSPIIANLFTVEDGYTIEKVDGNFVYIDTAKETQVVDISNPIMPAVIWRRNGYDEKGEPLIFTTTEKYAFAISLVDGFYVYDTSNPASPTLISHQSDLKGFDGFDDFTSAKSYLYILDGRNLHILNASDPTAIVEVGIYKFPSTQSGYSRINIIDNLAFLDNSLYSGRDPAKLTILDISNPEAPSFVTSYHWSDYSAISGSSTKTIFINSYDGVHVVDFSDPQHPDELGFYGLDDGYGTGPDSLALGPDNIIYVVSNPNGLYILRYSPSE